MTVEPSTSLPVTINETIIDMTEAPTTVSAVDTTVIITTEPPVDETTTTGPEETTTVATEAPTTLHVFDCQVDRATLEAAGQGVPLECQIGDDTDIIRVTIVINKSQLDLQTLRDRNVKIVVKDFMLMDMPMSTTQNTTTTQR